MTTENNKIIAKFLNMETMQRGKNGWGQCIFSFHHSWDSLMLVVEKIESLHVANNFIISATVCYLNIHDKFKNELIQFKANEQTKIQAVYNACLEFIKWYNEQNRK